LKVAWLVPIKELAVMTVDDPGAAMVGDRPIAAGDRLTKTVQKIAPDKRHLTTLIRGEGISNLGDQL
jgi:hypothetical protein